LTNCIGCAFTDSHVDNQTSEDIYVIIKTSKPNFDRANFKFFISKSGLTKYSIDSLTNTATFVLGPGQKLHTYEGPGSDPSKLLSSLKIVTSKQILSLDDKDAIKDAMTKSGTTYKLTVK
jgi:hypothetical protein